MSSVRVIAVVVTYNPGAECIPLLRSLKEQCAQVVVVDNASDSELLEPIREYATSEGLHLIVNEENLGIAAAQNQGIRFAQRYEAQFVLLSDDDSAPPAHMVRDLLSAFTDCQSITKTAAVGPLVGEHDGLRSDELVYVARRWGPRRASREELSEPLLPVAFLIASGCLISMSALEEVGMMDDELFIDHVDLEWGLRARKKGFGLFVATSCSMEHSLGDKVVKLPGRKQVVHTHSPVRNYYIVRNTLALIRSGTFTWRWSAGYLVWLFKYLLFNALVPPQRTIRVRLLARGVRDGISLHLGRLN